MKRLVSIFAALLLLIARPAADFDQNVKLLHSVVPIQAMISMGDFDATGNPILVLANICAAFSINEKEHLYATAEHCLGPDETFQGEPLRVIFEDKDTQVAVIKGRFRTPALKLQKGSATFGELVRGVGFPLGHPQPFMTFGHVSNPSADMSTMGFKGEWTITDLQGVGGFSGGPVVNEDNEIVSIHVFGWSSGSRYWGGIGGGTRQEDLAKQIGAYFES